jgi:PBSX family phage terminase large subunit
MARLTEIIAPSFYDLHDSMRHDEYEEVWCKGGRGSCKSSFFSVEIMLGLVSDKDANAVICRRYENEMRDTVFSQMQWAAIELGIMDFWKFTTSPMCATHLSTGQKILFKGADRPKKSKSAKIARGYVKYLWFEEIDQYGGMGDTRSVIQSYFRGTDKKQIFLASFNPPKSLRSWVNQEVMLPKPGRYVHTSDYRTVPKEWLGERFLTDAEHLRNTNEVAYRHEYLGEEVGTGLEIFNNVEVRPITAEEKSCFGDLHQGLDFGYAVDPLAFNRMYYDPKKRILWIFEEISGIGLSNRMLAEKMTLDQKRILTFADKAEPKSIDELRLDYNLNIMGAEKAPGSVEHGVKWLADLEKIIIDPTSCPLAASEFINYSLEVTRDGKVISRYPDKDNHSIDAVRYGLYNVIRAIAKPRAQEVRAMPIANRW